MLTYAVHIHRQKKNETKHCSVQYTTPHLSILCEKETKSFHAKSTKIYLSKLLHIGQFYISTKRETSWKQNQQ